MRKGIPGTENSMNSGRAAGQTQSAMAGRLEKVTKGLAPRFRV